MWLVMKKSFLSQELLSSPLEGGRAQCGVCPHRCRLGDGQLGRCRVRAGSAAGVRPIAGQGIFARGVGQVEQHPLLHFYPGMRTLGVGSAGCTAACAFCQNWELALAPLIDRNWQAQPLFQAGQSAIDTALQAGCGALAFTYNEPTVWPELLVELAAQAHTAGLYVILVTNGFVTEATLRFILPHIDGVKLDLKGPDERFYRAVAGISLAPVLDTIAHLHAAGVWHEISTVIIPGENDGDADLARMAEHILGSSGPETPWHLMRFFPAYRMEDRAPGDLTRLRLLRDRARGSGLSYVYISNIPNIAEWQTACPRCGRMLTQRRWGMPTSLPAACPSCGMVIAGRGLQEG